MRIWSGILGILRGDGSAVRALLLALALQILVPGLGVVPAAQAQPADGLTICTVKGMVTLVPDGQGGWTEQAKADATGVSCSFCLPLLSGHAAPSADVSLPLPRAASADRPTAPLPPGHAALPPGAARPRAPPALA